MRDELLNGETCRSVTEARVVIENWLEEYIHLRPRRGPWDETPAGFAAYCETGQVVGGNDTSTEQAV